MKDPRFVRAAALWCEIGSLLALVLGILGFRDSLALGSWGLFSLLLSVALWQEAGGHHAVEPGLARSPIKADS